MKVYIWGTGYLAKKYLKQNEVRDEDIIGFVESKRTKETFMGKKVCEPCELMGQTYDYILVCVLKTACEIKETIEKTKIPLSKVIFLNNWIWISGGHMVKTLPEKICKKVSDVQNDEEIEKIFPIMFEKYIARFNREASRYLVITRNGSDLNDKNDLLQEEGFSGKNYQTDYVRYRTFEMIADQINRENVGGAVAELGVFRGDFAVLINQKFKERRMYLFDTFESFDINEFNEELSKGYCENDFREGFKETSEEYVVNRMQYKEQLVLCKGLFPGTAKKIEDRFAFVSIDVDFEKSILEGLRYFYPRLTCGGGEYLSMTTTTIS